MKKKIYYSKSNNLSDYQFTKEKQFLENIFPKSEITMHEGKVYDPRKLEKADIVIGTSMNYNNFVGKGVINELLTAQKLNIPAYIIDYDKNISEQLVLRRYFFDYEIVNQKTWKDGYVKIYPVEIALMSEILTQ